MKLATQVFQEVIFKGKKYNTLDALLKARKAIGPARFYMKKSNKPLSSELFAIYTRLSTILDIGIVAQLGGTIIKSTAGRGVTPDFILDGKVGEIKAISTTTDQQGIVTKASKIGIAGGQGIKLTEGTKNLATGVSGNELTSERVRFSDDLLTQLRNAKNNQAELKQILSGKGNAVTALRRNFVLKSGDIRVPITVGNKKILKAIRFTWNDIKKNKYAKIKITENKDGDIIFNIYFTSSLVKQALNNANKDMQIALQSEAREIAVSLADEFAAFSPQVIDFLDKNYLVQSIEYDKGSALIGKGTIKRKKGKSESTNRFVSGAQLTAMLQKLMIQKMPKGPRRGPPLSTDILTERTGRFRRSTVAVPNYRKNMIRFMYDPIYKTFIDTPRNPDELIERSLREIVQKLFSRQFKIVRGF